MQFFIIFIFGAVVLGAGAMFSPAWQTRQPRIGLAAALATALVLGGAVFWAEAFGWDTLVIDYLLFALMSGVVLGGTLSQAQARAEAQGLELADEDQGWPGPKDLAFFTFAGLLAIVPLLVIVLPNGSHAPADAFLAMTAKLGNTFDTLTPFYPSAEVLYAPGFHALTAYLSLQLNQPVPLIQFGVAAVVVLVTVWLAYDLGAEMVDKRLGRAMVAALIGGLGMAGMYLNGYFVLLVGMMFALAFWIYALRVLRHGMWADMVAAGLMLGATFYASPTMTFILLAGFLPWLAVMWLPDAEACDVRPMPRTFAQVALGIPFVALLGTAPWWLNNVSQFGTFIGGAVYTPNPAYLVEMVAHHGIVIVALAGWGAYVALRADNAWRQGTRQMALMALAWLIVIADASLVGILPSLLGLTGLDARLIAWFAPIIPYTVLGGIALLWLWERIASPLRQRVNANAYILMGVATAMAGIIILVGGQFITSDSLGRDDVEALRWIQRETPTESIILNPPDDTWTASIVERDTVYLPALPVLSQDAMPTERAEALRIFWDSPVANASLLANYDITHIFIPQRYDNPFMGWADSDDSPLTLLHAEGEALIYAVEETNQTDE
jgi:hypothetical protein